jgi:tetratricopeptide (TPR) repeat protein
MKVKLITLLALTAGALSIAPTQAADTPAPTRATAPAAVPVPAAATAADKLANARALIAAKQWPGALDELKRVNDTAGADWNNLMGYSLRKGKSPDLAASQQHYDEALRIDPNHRNALEYSGELFLMKGELDKAEARLATLAGVCSGSCEQHTELKAAIEKYKTAGNKFVANW